MCYTNTIQYRLFKISTDPCFSPYAIQPSLPIALLLFKPVVYFCKASLVAMIATKIASMPDIGSRTAITQSPLVAYVKANGAEPNPTTALDPDNHRSSFAADTEVIYSSMVVSNFIFHIKPFCSINSRAITLVLRFRHTPRYLLSWNSCQTNSAVPWRYVFLALLHGL